MRKFLNVVIVAALVVVWAPALMAQDSSKTPNPCPDKQVCVQVPGVAEQCFKTCCGAKNKPDKDNVQDCTCETDSFCTHIRGKDICLNADQADAYKTHKASKAAAAHRATVKAKLAELETSKAELAKVKGDVAATRLVLLKALASSLELLALTEGWANEVLAEAQEAFDTTVGATDELADKRTDLRDALKDFRAHLKDTVEPAKKTAQTLVATPDKAEAEAVQASIGALQKLQLDLSDRTGKLEATRKLVLDDHERDLQAEIETANEALSKERAKATERHPFEPFLGTVINCINVPGKAVMAAALFGARYRFRNDEVFQPTLGIRGAAGQYPNARAYMGTFLEFGSFIRVGDHFEFVILGHAGGMWGYYESSGAGPGLGGRGGVVIRFTENASLMAAYNYDAFVPTKNTETYEDSWKYHVQGFAFEFNLDFF